MEILVWVGAALSTAGLAAILWCIVAVIRARRVGLTDAALRARLQRAVTINLAAFATSVLGLMLIVVGLMLA